MIKVFVYIILISFNSLAGFPSDVEVSNRSPFDSGQSYEFVKIGIEKTVKTRRKDYSYRYITLYDKESYVEDISEVPSLEEYCHEQGDRVASWSFVRSYERSISIGVDLSLLGIQLSGGSGVSKTFEVEVTRWIQAVLNISALHTAQFQFQRLEGIIYKQVFYPQTGEVRNVRLKRNRFFVNRLNPVFKIKRDILQECN